MLNTISRLLGDGQRRLSAQRLRIGDNLSMDKHMTICTQNNSISLLDSFSDSSGRTTMKITVVKWLRMVQYQCFKVVIVPARLTFANSSDKNHSFLLIIIRPLLKFVRFTVRI